LVQQYAKMNRAHALPDFWVLLTNGLQVDIEVKNLGFNMKPYKKNPEDTPFWALVVSKLFLLDSIET
jgi:hypothetical protein